MRRPISSLLLLVLSLAACQGQPPPANMPPTEAAVPGPPAAAWDDRSIFSEGLIASQQAALAQLIGASAYRLEWQIADDLVHVTGQQAVRYTNLEDAALDEIRFRLLPNTLGGTMLVSSVSVDGESAAPEYALEDSLMRVPLAAPLRPGESAVIQIDFVVIVPTELESNYGILASTEGVLALAHAYPMIAVYDDEGWNAEIPPDSGDVTYADAGFYLVRVTAPADLVLVASGREVARETDNGRQTVTFAAGPARDFFLAASAAYVVLTETVGEYTFRSYAPADAHDGAQLALETAVRAIADFGRRYAPYPYTEFDIAATPTYALGIEYPGMTAVSLDLYDLSGNFNGTPASVYLESTVAHEVGHQWFYNMVGNDQLDEPWLDESLTQYATWQYYKDTYGASGGAGFEQSLEGRWQGIDRAEIPVGLPVSAYSDREYSAIIYGRGALFFDALAKQMGRQAFDAFLGDYTQSHQWGIATSKSLQQAAEGHCNCDLDPLFDQWIHPTAP